MFELNLKPKFFQSAHFDKKSPARINGAFFWELPNSRRVSLVMFSREFYFYLEYYFVTLCVPAIIIALFVLYVYLKDRDKRL